MRLLAAALTALLLTLGQAQAQGVGFGGTIPIGTSTVRGILQCGTGTSCNNGILSVIGAGGGVTPSGTISTGTVPVWASPTSLSGVLPYSSTGTNVLLTTGSNGLISPTVVPPINLASGNAGGVTGALPYANLAPLLSNQIVGTTAAGVPSGLTIPSCSSSNQGLTWTSGIGPGCNTYPAAVTPGAANTPLFANGTGGFTAGARSGNTTTLASVSGSITSTDFALFDVSGNIVDATYGAGHFLGAANNFSDVSNVATARTNLGLGTLATANAVNLATQTSGVLPSTQGGAGGITGLLKANGAGVVTAATAGNDYLINNQTVTLSGAVTGAGATAISTSLTAGAASANIGTLANDLSGTLPNPTVTGLQGRPVSATAPTSGQIIEWTGSSWTPMNAPVSGISALTQDVTATGTGSQPATVVGLQGHAIAGTAPMNGQLLVYGPTAWTPGNLPASGVTPGSYTVASASGLYFCETINVSGQITTMNSGQCGTAPLLLNNGGNLLLDSGGNVLLN